MKDMTPFLLKQYKRERSLLPSDDTIPHGLINITEALKAYYYIADYFLHAEDKEAMLIGLKSKDLLCSAIARQHVSFGGTPKWKDPWEIAASLYYGLVKNHAFHDGNKRVSLLVLIYYLWKKGRIVDCKKTEFEELTVRVAGNTLYRYGKSYAQLQKHHDQDVKFIASFIRKKTRRTDKNYYPMTYREFNSRLAEFDCKLDGQSGGFISVYKEVEESNVLGFKKKKVWKKVMQIGFPGWTKQLRARAMKETLKSLGLTAEKGIDSRVFHKGGEPLSYLIEEFEAPLMRLKDK